MRSLIRAATTMGAVMALGASALVVASPAVAVNAPTGVSVVVATSDVPENGGRFTVSWQAVTGAVAYRVEASLAGTVRASATVSAPATSAVIGGLTGGARYSVSVLAADASGYSGPSIPVTRDALTVPSAVSVRQVTTYDDTVLVEWDPPASNGGSPVTSYRVQQRVSGDNYTTLTDNLNGEATSFTVTGTSRPSPSDYRIAANNGYGWSASAPVTTPPNAPRSLGASVASATLTATWSPPIVGQGQVAIAGYLVEWFGPGGDDSALTSASPFSTSGLANGAYALYVSAIDIEDNVGPSATSSFTVSGGADPTPAPQPGTPPGPPTSVVAVAGDASATVSWTAPSQSGSFPITNYRVTSVPASTSCTSATTSCTVSGLANGTTYTFTVAALNGAGYGQESAPSNPVTPRGSPSPEPTPTPSPTPSPNPEPTPTPDVEMPARIGVERGVPARVVLTTDRRLGLSTLKAYIVVQGKRRNLRATFRALRDGDIVMRFTVDRKPGRYEILLSQVLDGKATILDRSRLIVRRGRRVRE